MGCLISFDTLYLKCPETFDASLRTARVKRCRGYGAKCGLFKFTHWVRFMYDKVL